jgi:hypothetical protein
VIVYGVRIGRKLVLVPRILTSQDRQHDQRGAKEAYSVRRKI